MDDVRAFLSIELSIQLDGLHFEPLYALAQCRDPIVVHEGPHRLVLLHLQKLELLPHLLHLALICSLEITLVRQQLFVVVAIDALG